MGAIVIYFCSIFLSFTEKLKNNIFMLSLTIKWDFKGGRYAYT